MYEDNIKILEKSGVKNQILIWVEELSELQKALTKWGRKYDELNGQISKELRDDIVEEYVDVIICLNQICKAIKITDAEVIKWYEYKIDRQKKRMGLK